MASRVAVPPWVAASNAAAEKILKWNRGAAEPMAGRSPTEASVLADGVKRKREVDAGADDPDDDVDVSDDDDTEEEYSELETSVPFSKRTKRDHGLPSWISDPVVASALKTPFAQDLPQVETTVANFQTMLLADPASYLRVGRQYYYLETAHRAEMLLICRVEPWETYTHPAVATDIQCIVLEYMANNAKRNQSITNRFAHPDPAVRGAGQPIVRALMKLAETAGLGLVIEHVMSDEWMRALQSSAYGDNDRYHTLIAPRLDAFTPIEVDPTHPSRADLIHIPPSILSERGLLHDRIPRPAGSLNGVFPTMDTLLQHMSLATLADQDVELRVSTGRTGRLYDPSAHKRDGFLDHDPIDFLSSAAFPARGEYIGSERILADIELVPHPAPIRVSVDDEDGTIEPFRPSQIMRVRIRPDAIADGLAGSLAEDIITMHFSVDPHALMGGRKHIVDIRWVDPDFVNNPIWKSAEEKLTDYDITDAFTLRVQSQGDVPCLLLLRPKNVWFEFSEVGRRVEVPPMDIGRLIRERAALPPGDRLLVTANYDLYHPSAFINNGIDYEAPTRHEDVEYHAGDAPEPPSAGGHYAYDSAFWMT